MRSSSTCGPRRSIACWTMGLPRNGCSPLSTPPMRLPWPPARMTPVTSIGNLALAHEAVLAGEEEVALVDRATDHGDADLARDLVAHLREARARHEHRDSHLRRLDHHLRGEPAGGVEDLVAPVDAFEPHPARDRVDRVVAADVLDESE